MVTVSETPKKTGSVFIYLYELLYISTKVNISKGWKYFLAILLTARKHFDGNILQSIWDPRCELLWPWFDLQLIVKWLPSLVLPPKYVFPQNSCCIFRRNVSRVFRKSYGCFKDEKMMSAGCLRWSFWQTSRFNQFWQIPIA